MTDHTDLTAPSDRAHRKTQHRVLFISDHPCRTAARGQITAAVGRDVDTVQRPARQLVSQPRMLRGYSVAVLHQVDFALTSRLLTELAQAGVATVLVPRYQDAESAGAQAKPKVVGYVPLATPAFHNA